MTTQNVQKAHDQLQVLGALTVKFADIHRAILYPDGHMENDVEHSFHLALSAVEIAANYHSDLDVGLVSQFSIVHDLPEIYAGDVPSYKRTAKQEKQKQVSEEAAIKKLLAELPPHTAQLLQRYEQQQEPEARFVRFIDKLLPPIIHAAAVEANKEDFFERFNIRSLDDALAADKQFFEKLQQMFPEFDFLLLLRLAVTQTSRGKFFPEAAKQT